jgi:lipoyl(octanoyl) transferase
MTEVFLHTPGVVEYKDAWKLQKSFYLTNFNIKTGEKTGETQNHLFLLQHPHVFTLGNSGNEANLLLNKEMLQKVEASFYKIERGGDITYHGPGQLVGYPVFDLDSLKISIKDFVYGIEEILIKTVARYNIKATRVKGATGVWIDAQKPGKARKIAAIGMKISKKVSMHGFALNVNTNLDYFNYIIPCGINDKGVTSIEKETHGKISFEEVTNIVVKEFENVFNVTLKPVKI